MAAKEIMPVYDAMVRLFVAAMPNTKISTQILGHIMNIPMGTMRSIMEMCPPPNGAQIIQGGHRGLELFIVQPTFISSLGRCELVKSIMDEAIWKEYGVVLNPNTDEIIAEVDKIVFNIGKLTGNMTKKAATIHNGGPDMYRLSWFLKDIMHKEYYHTIQEAIKGKKISVQHKSTVGTGRSAIVVKTAEVQNTPVKRTTMEQYGLMSFIADIHKLIESECHYKAAIKNMEDKINREYPALIAQKEAEKAAAERTVESLKDRVRTIEKINANQMIEICNLKKHPKYSGFVKKDGGSRVTP